MPRGIMDDIIGEVADEKLHDGGLENRLGQPTWVRIPHSPP